MRHEVINPPGQHMVRQPFHQGYSLLPAKRAEYLTHRPALMQRVDMRRRTPQLSKSVMKELSIPVRSYPLMGFLIHPRHYLQQHDIDPSHVKGGHGSEIVAGAASQTPVGIVILYNMADMQNTPLTAPVMDLV